MSAETYNKKHLTDVTQIIGWFQAQNGLVVDGMAGPRTMEVFHKLRMAVGKDSEGTSEQEESRLWKPFNGPLDKQPTNRTSVYQMFGDPASAEKPGRPDRDWMRENTIECHWKHGNALPGVPQKRFITVHRSVEPYLREALRRAISACPDYPIEKFACLNFRRIRRDPSLPLSLHSWGIAFDLNHHWNRAVQFKRGDAIPKAWSAEWYEVWPKGVPKAFVDAFASCGFAWGSDWDEDGDNTDHLWQDPMHFEFVARDGVSNLV